MSRSSKALVLFAKLCTYLTVIRMYAFFVIRNIDSTLVGILRRENLTISGAELKKYVIFFLLLFRFMYV